MSNPKLTDADLKKQMAGRKVIGTHGEWPAKIFECVEDAATRVSPSVTCSGKT